MNGKTILVAGGSGFIGQLLCPKLIQAGFKVINADLVDCKQTDVKFQKIDITKKRQLEILFTNDKINYVVNLVSLLHSASRLDPIKATITNIIGTTRLLEKSYKFGIELFMQASSTCALGEQGSPQKPVTEDTLALPVDIYGETKRYIEKLGSVLSDMHDFTFIAARLPLIVGAGQPTRTSAWRMEIFNKLCKGGKIRFGFHEDEIIPLAPVEDVAEHLFKLITVENLKGHIYHTPYEAWLVRNLIQTIEEIGENLVITSGDKKVKGGPVYVSWDKIKCDLGLQKPSLKQRLIDYKNYLINKNFKGEIHG
ncbi:MAG TPA: NAD(P)-dependent oxidoreductase [Anaerolineae bacterium]|nr:NAD(P)-dependent oxidoreductase [Anaerolineae bacterium]